MQTSYEPLKDLSSVIMIVTQFTGGRVVASRSLCHGSHLLGCIAGAEYVWLFHQAREGDNHDK